ncbi:integrase/recombinase XerD [Kaistia soli DSM 19436]|uniref:Integrase/recombinase XerD n=1 Tax=Kaistia soli DSM 19436 TaxID=1122133 RepID=A0A1M4YSS1_9HYPH|nr:site-specific integrase [Kaistia soli]SHF08783.1 integrase/recombinase XerD [Kaistia soli DSM 19436]
MIGQTAKVLGGADIRRALRHASRRRDAQRSAVIILLSVKAGLRACEIARLTWRMVTDTRGRVATTIELPNRAAKMGSGRRIPIHPTLRSALVKLQCGATDCGPVIRSQRGGAMTPDAIVNWFASLYRELELQGCSSHSGRRTFVTQAARQVGKAGGSLRDVQILVGHRSLKTTQGYIDGSEDAQRRLVRSL